MANTTVTVPHFHASAFRQEFFQGMRKLVNIVLSDRNWILERLGAELASRIPYLGLSDRPDQNAPLQYYITYGARQHRVSPIEVALFTHREMDPATSDRFFNIAKEVDHAVCMSNTYENELRNAGVSHVSTIAPGVDLDRFSAKVKIGVVGRTYPSGRKGEALVADVMNIEGIEWHFTGEGWPGPALNMPYECLPDFYRSMDYILVPSLYEGGPMPVVEALAVGTQVIASSVGWVPQFKSIIRYETGDVEDLRRVLR